MSHPAIVVFTGRPVGEILDRDHGSAAWRLDRPRAEAAEYLVCTRNRHNRDNFPPTPEPHRAAFLIGRIDSIVPYPPDPDRWLIRISEYVEQLIPDIWGKSGKIHLRYPVWYTTLEELGIDLATLPPFKPMSGPTSASQLSEASARFPLPPPARSLPSRSPSPSDQETAERFDAILAQFDRIRDLPEPADPLQWDERGLPR